MCSSRRGSPLAANDDEILGDDVVGVHPSSDEEESSLERNSTEENVSDDEETVSAVNPLARDASAQVIPVLQNLLLSIDSQRERLTGLIQVFAPTTEETNATVNAEGEQVVYCFSFADVRTEYFLISENSQIAAREAELASQVHFLEQSVQRLEEEIENQKKLNAELEEQIRRLTESSDP